MDKTTIEVDNIVQTALNRIELNKQRIIAFEWVMKFFEGKYGNRRHSNETILKTASHIRVELQKELNNAYRDLMIWAIVFPKEAEKKAKKAVVERFLNESQSIMHYLNIDAEHPPCWSVELEENFRELVAQSLTKNKTEKDNNG